MKITRRRLGMAVMAPAARAAQNQPQPPIPSNAEEELAAARQQNKLNSQTLEKFEVPMAIEPAFQFKA